MFVLDNTKKPLTPCSPARARMLLRDGKAAVWRTVPFTIIIRNDITNPVVKRITVKIDPGSKTTGFSLVDTIQNRVVFAAELIHRGCAIKNDIHSRAIIRRARRGRKTRYRQARWRNRRRLAGWLPPSLMHRVYTIMTWIHRFINWCAVCEISIEMNKFDTRKMQDATIHGIEYQQGTLSGYNVRQYLLEKWDHRCAYCGSGSDVLQIDHVQPKSKGGSNKITNLVIACKRCNQRKGNNDVDVFLKRDPVLLKKIQLSLSKPLSDAASVNATRNALITQIEKTNLPIETGSGSLTMFNRTKNGYPKQHWIDAACNGESGATVIVDLLHYPIQIRSMGHGERQMVRVDKHGFPRSKAKTTKIVKGFKTGDLVRLVQPKGKYAGTYTGRLVGIRSNGMFDIRTSRGMITAIHYNYTLIQSADGYLYENY